MEKFTMNDTTIAFIGLGLIGGSLAKGIKRARPDIRIMAYMRTRSKLEQAKKDGIVDVILDGIDEQLKQCDLIFLCTPVEYNAQYLSKIRSYLKPGALITDVGSTKTDIHKEILRQEPVFRSFYRYLTGTGCKRRDRSSQRCVRTVRSEYRYLYHGCSGFCGNQQKCKTYYSHPSDVQRSRYSYLCGTVYGNTIRRLDDYH